MDSFTKIQWKTMAECGLLLVLMLGAWTVRAADSTSAPAAPPLEIQAERYEFNPDTGEAVGRGNVRIQYQDVYLRADEVHANLKTHDVEAAGHVVLRRGAFEWHGARVQGNVDRRDFTVYDYAVRNGVWYASGDSARYFSDGHAELQNVTLSTCEYLVDEPHHEHYSLSAATVVVSPKGRFKARHVVYRVGRVPVFYLPFVAGDSDRRHSSIEIKPGYDGDWGAYLLLGRSWSIGEDGATKFMLHLRSSRGVALGNRTEVHTQHSDTDFLAYGMHDLDAPETTPGYNRRFETEDNRYRLRFYHREQLAERWQLRLRLDALSDIDMLEDWFENEYDRVRQPASIADLSWTGDGAVASLSLRPRLNSFYTAVERLPEARFDVPRRALGRSGLVYMSRSSAARLKMNWRSFSLPRPGGLNDPTDYSTWRLDTLHFVYRPFNLRDGVEIVPRAGVRVTWYNRSSKRGLSTDDLNRLFRADDPDRVDDTTSIVNYDGAGGSRTRVAGELGIEASAKFFRVWDPFRRPRWEIDGLRHVVQPYVNYTWIPEPSEDREHLYFFDEIDRIPELNFVRVGVRQRLQTRREQRIYTLARVDTYADLHFHREKDRDHPGDLGARAELRATENVTIWGLLLLDMGEGEVNRGELSLQFGRPDRVVVTLSYLFRNDFIPRSLFSMGSLLDDYSWSLPVPRYYDRQHSVRLALDFPINDLTDGHASWEYDIEEGELARQRYEIVRDLHCWKGALRFDEDNGDMRVMVVLFLKAFPGVSIGAGM